MRLFQMPEGFEAEWRFSHFKGQSDARVEVIVREWLDDIAGFAVDSFRNHVPVQSGELLESIEEGRVDKHPYGWSVSISVTSPHADWVYEGTGLFGPKHQIITAEHGNVLVFSIGEKHDPVFTKGKVGKKEMAEGVIFTKKMKGQRPNPFLDEVHKDVDQYVRGKKRELAARLSRAIRD